MKESAVKALESTLRLIVIVLVGGVCFVMGLRFDSGFERGVVYANESCYNLVDFALDQERKAKP